MSGLGVHQLVGAGANKARLGALGGALAGAAGGWVASATGDAAVGDAVAQTLLQIFDALGVLWGAVVGYLLQYALTWVVPGNRPEPPA